MGEGGVLYTSSDLVPNFVTITSLPKNHYHISSGDLVTEPDMPSEQRCSVRRKAVVAHDAEYNIDTLTEGTMVP